MLVQVVLRRAGFAFDQAYTYEWPENAPVPAEVGWRVLLPFGKSNRLIEAFVWKTNIDSDGETSRFLPKTIERLLGDGPVLTLEQLQLAWQMKLRYACTFGEALSCMLPPGLSSRIVTRLRLREDFRARLQEARSAGQGDRSKDDPLPLMRDLLLSMDRGDLARSPVLCRLLDELESAGAEGCIKEDLLRFTSASTAHLSKLEQASCIVIESIEEQKMKSRQEKMLSITDEEAAIALLENEALSSENYVRVLEFLLDYEEAPLSEVQAACQVSAAVIRAMEKKNLIRRFVRPALSRNEAHGLVLPAREPALQATEEQAAILAELLADLQSGVSGRRIKEYLLQGITGSGKTEIYLQLAEQLLAWGRACMILVPEISLTPQMIDRFVRRFGNEVAVMHSRLSPRERFEQWRLIKAGKLRLLVGARSAIFMPLENIGLIVIDEEQESSYQSEINPRYHATTIARLRVRDKNCLLLLGSATPSLENYLRTQSGKSKLLSLTKRPGAAHLPHTQIVDMKQELRQGNPQIFSALLVSALETCFAENHQAMLFINRRGHSGIYLCRDCGYKVNCDNCSVPMTYHSRIGRAKERLLCHYCGKLQKPDLTCPQCGSSRIAGFGLGTQQVEEYFLKNFPGKKVLRMDQDSTRGRGSHKDILDRFQRKEADCLIGTQMIAKGHDIENVTLVGIVSCDQLLSANDFRSSERGFQLITQAAGRAGRGEQPGSVILQTYDTGHFALHAAAAQDYQAFYKEEIQLRRWLKYPPFRSYVTLICQGKDAVETKTQLQNIRVHLDEAIRNDPNLQDITLYEIQEAWPFKLAGKSRYQLRFSSGDLASLSYLMSLARQMKRAEQISLSLQLDPA